MTQNLAFMIAGLLFLGIWGYSFNKWGFLWGLTIGWIPAYIGAIILLVILILIFPSLG